MDNVYTVRKFREKLADMFNLLDSGVHEIEIKRGESSYFLTKRVHVKESTKEEKLQAIENLKASKVVVAAKDLECLCKLIGADRCPKHGRY